jgi:hypothetical protein
MVIHQGSALGRTVAAAMLALSALGAPAWAQSVNTFKLTDIELHGPGSAQPIATGNWTLTSLTKGALGGDAVATFRGVPGYAGKINCTGSVQHVYYHWRFNRDATYISTSQPVVVTLIVTADSGPCAFNNPFMDTSTIGYFQQAPSLSEAAGRYFAKAPPGYANVGMRSMRGATITAYPGGFSVGLYGNAANPMGSLGVRIDYNYRYLPGGATSPVAPAPPRPPTQVTFGARSSQPQQRGPNGQVTVESANIYPFSCNGRTFYLYQYTDRAGGQPTFRAILPPNWGSPLGGRDFATENEALAAACR